MDYLDVEKYEQNHLWKKTCQNHSGSDPKKLPILLQIQKFQLYLVVNKASWNFFNERYT